MIEYIKECLVRNKLDLQGKKVVVGVSTGVDSMTLLDTLLNGDFGCEIIVAHVNHAKREESNIEEKFITNFCNEHHLKIYCLHLQGYDFKNHNFQEEARVLRQKFFYEIMDKEKAKVLMLAHHLNDDIETMMMRIIRGSSLKGYAGMDEYTLQEGRIVLRPFLKVLKKDIMAYAKEHKIIYYEDRTNNEDHYTRNRIRHHIVKDMFKENSNVHLKFLELKETLNAANEIVSKQRDEIITEMVQFSKDHFTFSRDEFMHLSSFLQVEVLFALLKDYKFSRQNINEFIKLIYSNKQNLKIVYKNLSFVKEYNDITFFFYEIEKQDVNIVIDEIKTYDVNAKYEIVVSKKNNNLITNLNKLWYNSNMLPVTVRTRRDGDKISLEYGTKKVKKLLIDEKVGILKRDEVLLLEKNQEILAVFGYCKSMKLRTLKDCDIVIELKEKEKNDN